nr:MAG TPA: Putative HNHc nuclease [Caudoviricetes sp.]
MKGEFCTNVMTEWETFSLAYNQISIYDAGQFIEYIIEWCFQHEVPFRHQQYFVGSEIQECSSCILNIAVASLVAIKAMWLILSLLEWEEIEER